MVTNDVFDFAINAFVFTRSLFFFFYNLLHFSVQAADNNTLDTKSLFSFYRPSICYFSHPNFKNVLVFIYIHIYVFYLFLFYKQPPENKL